MDLNEFLKKHGRRVSSKMEAERYWADGDKIFVWHEIDEQPFEVTDISVLQKYAPDQVLVVSADLFAAETASEHTGNAAAELTRLKQNIRIELDLCDVADTPFVCANIQAPEGYEKIEHLIIQKILSEKITISQAIIEIEVDLNPNTYEPF